MTNTGKPSFEFKHVLELVFASIIGAITASFYGILGTLYNSVLSGTISVSIFLFVLIETIIFLVVVASCAIAFIYFVEWIQCELKQRKKISLRYPLYL
jgi:hypothetical protein